MLGLEFHELISGDAHELPRDSTNRVRTGGWCPVTEDLLRVDPGALRPIELLHAHAIHTQVARSNPRVLRVQPP